MKKFEKGDTIYAYSNGNKHIRGFITYAHDWSFMSEICLVDLEGMIYNIGSTNDDSFFERSIFPEWKIFRCRLVLTEKYKSKIE